MIRGSCVILLSLSGGCLSAGCAMKVDDLFGYSNPTVVVKKSLFGFVVKVPTDVRGKLEGDYDPNTGIFHVKTEFDSKSSPVIKAEGERISENFVKTQQMHFASIDARTKMISEAVPNAMREAAGLVTTVTAFGGAEAGKKVADKVPDMLTVITGMLAPSALTPAPVNP